MSTDNEVAPLPKTGERVIDEESTKTFRCEAVVLYLDDEDGKYLYEGAEAHFENPVPVFNSEHKRIGAAALSVEGKVVKAEIFLDYHTPERLNIETKSVPVYAHINAYEAMDNSTGRWRCTDTNIVAIDLDSTPTPDKRIDPIA